MNLSLVRRAAAGIAVSLLAGACGAAGGVVHTLAAVPTKSQVGSAFHAVSGLSGVDITLKLDATAAQIQAADTAGGTSARDAALLAGSDLHLVVVNASGGTLNDLKDHPGDVRVRFTTDVDNDAVFDLRYASQVLYGRADVQKILQLAGGNQSDLDKIKAQIPPDPALKFVTDALDGNWVSLDVRQFKGLAQEFSNDPQLKQMFSALASPGVTAPSKSTIDRIRSAIGSALDRDITVTKGSTDKTLGTEFVVSAPAHKLVSDLAGTFTGVLPPAFQQSFQQQLPKALGAVPDKTVSAQVFVKNGVLRAVRIDLAQFDTKIPASASPFYLEADIVPTTATVDVPSGSTPIDLKAAISAFMQNVIGRSNSATSNLSGSGM